VALFSLYFLEAVKRIVRATITFMLVLALLAAANIVQNRPLQPVSGASADPSNLSNTSATSSTPDTLAPAISEGAVPATSEGSASAKSEGSMPAATSVATSIPPSQRPHFVPIDLPAAYLHEDLSLAQRFADWPSGEVQLAAIPFRFDARASYIQTQFEWPNVTHSLKLPDRITIPVNVANVQSVYLLLNLSYGCDWAASAASHVGDVWLRLDGGESLMLPLVTGENIREWVVDTAMCNVVQGTRMGNIQQVWSRPRSDTGARAMMDMIRIDVPAEYTTRILMAIVIDDTSIRTVNSFDPSIILFGVTVLAQ